jgi:tRNA 5-methylaminomethyl-2-thiouridine biosynthesis bifunctional protein
VATWSVARIVRDHLAQCGFALARRPGLPPKRDSLAGTYAPAWTPRHLTQLRQPVPESRLAERHAAVVGAGIAGASVAASLAARGWRVTVLDAAVTPAAGASGLPAGIFAPHVSPDDGRLAQLTREGVRAMRQRCTALLAHGQDWADTGVLELPVGRERRLPPAWRAAEQAHEPHPGLESSRPARADDAPAWRADWERQHRLLASEPLWHVHAGWVRPAQLVRAQLAHPGIQWRGGCQVTRLERQSANATSDQPAPVPADTSPQAAGSPSPARDQWALFNDHGVHLATADLVVLAAGPATAALVQRWCTPEDFPTHQVHGLVTLGDDAALDTNSGGAEGMATSAADATHAPGGPAADMQAKALNPEYEPSPLAHPSQNPDTLINPVNGHGSFLRGIPGDRGRFWCTGASFLRELPRGFDAATIAAEHQANLQRLADLLPVTAQRVRPQWRAGQVWHWHGARCTVADRVPLVGPLRPDAPASAAPWVCTAMGARGLTLGVLAGELLAAWVHGEPLPIARSLAAKLAAHRFMQEADGDR